MASSTFSSITTLLLLLTILSISEATEFMVGGSSDAWVVPPSTTDSLNQWAERNRFQIGDSLVWHFDPSKDSVLEVTRKDYLSCSRSSPIAEYKNSTTVVTLQRSGAHYFISGAQGACEEGEKLIVVVLSEKHRLRVVRFAPAPAPALFEVEGPAVSPTSGAVVERIGVFGAVVMVLCGVMVM